MGKIGLGDAPQEYNQYKGYDKLYKNISTHKLILKREILEKKQEENYYKQREVKHGSGRYRKIDNLLDDTAAALRAIKRILDDRDGEGRYQLYGTMDIYIDKNNDLYIKNIYSDEHSHLEIDHEDAHKHISIIVLNDISKEGLEN